MLGLYKTKKVSIHMKKMNVFKLLLKKNLIIGLSASTKPSSRLIGQPNP